MRHLLQRCGTWYNAVALVTTQWLWSLRYWIERCQIIVTPNAVTLVTVLRHLSQRSFSNCHSSAALVRTLQHLSTQRSRTAALIATLWHWLQHWHTGHIAAAYIYPMVGPKQCNGQDTTSNRGNNTSATVDFCSNKNNKFTLKVDDCSKCLFSINYSYCSTCFHPTTSNLRTKSAVINCRIKSKMCVTFFFIDPYLMLWSKKYLQWPLP